MTKRKEFGINYVHEDGIQNIYTVSKEEFKKRVKAYSKKYHGEGVHMSTDNPEHTMAYIMV